MTTNDTTRELAAAMDAENVPLMRTLRLRLMFEEVSDPERTRLAWVPLSRPSPPHPGLDVEHRREVFAQRAKALAANRSRLQELAYFFPESVHLLRDKPAQRDKILMLASRFANIWRVDWPEWSEDPGEMRERVEALVHKRCPDLPEAFGGGQ